MKLIKQSKTALPTDILLRGKAVNDFEKAFADYLGAKYCLGCGNGTDALEIILHSLHIGSGDEVIVPALTWISTAEAVNNVGAEPVFVDGNIDTYNIDHSKIEGKIHRQNQSNNSCSLIWVSG